MGLPEQFGEYTLVRRLAVGGMGELYLAQRPGVAGFSKQLVVKRIRPQLAHDRSFVEMFLNEGRVAAMIDHPNVVHIYELGEVNGAYFMAMEYVAGKDLGTLLSRNGGPLDLPNALIVIGGICEGIGFAHRAGGPDGQPLGLVHRDLNPQNVLISYSGTVKITDFGIAKARLEHRKETQAGVLKGKFGYLSPEQARGRSVDARSDIYSLGLLLFEITVGQPAIPGNSDTQRLYAAAEGVVQRPTTFFPDYPPELETIYLKATAKRPGDRYQTVKEMQEALLGFQVDRRLVTISSKLADLMEQLFVEEAELEQRGVTPAQATREAPGRQVQVRPAGRGDVRPVDPEFHLAQTVMEPRSPVAQDDQVTVEETRLPPPDEEPALAEAETKMLDRSPAEEEGVGGGQGLLAAETKLLDREAQEPAPDLLAITVPRDAKAPAPAQPAKRRSRWPVILLSTVITLCVAGSLTYYLLVYRPAVEAHTTGRASNAHPDLAVDSKAQTGDDAALPQTAPLSDAAALAADDQPDQGVEVAAGSDAGAVDRLTGAAHAPVAARVPVAITCTPPVRVYWRGRRLGRTPVKTTLPPGGHRLMLRNRELGIRVTRLLRVPRRGEKRVGYEVRQGLLLIKARPWAHVKVDGKGRGTTPIEPLTLYEGTHLVKLTNDEHGTHTVRVSVRPGETTRLVHRFEK